MNEELHKFLTEAIKHNEFFSFSIGSSSVYVMAHNSTSFTFTIDSPKCFGVRLTVMGLTYKNKLIPISENDIVIFKLANDFELTYDQLLAMYEFTKPNQRTPVWTIR